MVHAILQDEPMKMRGLADIFKINVEAIHEMWIIYGMQEGCEQYLKKEISSLKMSAENCADTVIADLYEGKLLIFLSDPYSRKEAEEQISEIFRQTCTDNLEITLTRCSNLRNTSDVREAYLCHRDYLADGRRVFPGKTYFQTGELQFVRECRMLIEQGEKETERCLRYLVQIGRDREGRTLIDTLSVYLLEGEMSVIKTSEIMHLHRNTIKYRLHRLSELIGYRPDKMPEGIELYRAAVVRRLLNSF